MQSLANGNSIHNDYELDTRSKTIIKNYRGLSPNYRRERWTYVHLIRRSANHSIIYLRPIFGLQKISHCHVTRNNTTFGLPSGYRKISHLRVLSIHTNYGLATRRKIPTIATYLEIIIFCYLVKCHVNMCLKNN